MAIANSPIVQLKNELTRRICAGRREDEDGKVQGPDTPIYRGYRGWGDLGGKDHNPPVKILGAQKTGTPSCLTDSCWVYIWEHPKTKQPVTCHEVNFT